MKYFQGNPAVLQSKSIGCKKSPPKNARRELLGFDLELQDGFNAKNRQTGQVLTQKSMDFLKPDRWEEKASNPGQALC